MGSGGVAGADAGGAGFDGVGVPPAGAGGPGPTSLSTAAGGDGASGSWEPGAGGVRNGRPACRWTTPAGPVGGGPHLTPDHIRRRRRRHLTLDHIRRRRRRHLTLDHIGRGRARRGQAPERFRVRRSRRPARAGGRGQGRKSRIRACRLAGPIGRRGNEPGTIGLAGARRGGARAGHRRSLEPLQRRGGAGRRCGRRQPVGPGRQGRSEAGRSAAPAERRRLGRAGRPRSSGWRR